MTVTPPKKEPIVVKETKPKEEKKAITLEGLDFEEDVEDEDEEEEEEEEEEDDEDEDKGEEKKPVTVNF